MLTEQARASIVRLAASTPWAYTALNARLVSRALPATSGLLAGLRLVGDVGPVRKGDSNLLTLTARPVTLAKNVVIVLKVLFAVVAQCPLLVAVSGVLQANGLRDRDVGLATAADATGL